MPRFIYHAIAADGRPTSGELEAPSWDDASRVLQGQGLRVESLRLVDESAAADVADRGGENAADDHITLGKKDFEVITGQIVDLARAQLPLAAGLAILSQELPSGRLRRGLSSISRKLERGMSLEEVLTKHGAPNELRALLRSGLRTGRISDVLSQYVAHLRSQATTRLRVTLTFAYPLLMLLLAGAIAVFLLFAVVPEFKKIFQDFDTELPWITLLLISITDFFNDVLFSNFMVYIGWPLLVIVILLLAVTALFVRIGSGRGALHSLLRRVPVAGSIVHWSSMARFCHMLAVLIDNKVPLPEALVLAGDGIDDAGIRADSRELALRISTGDSLVTVGRALSGFPGSFIQTLMQYKQTQALPEALHAIADMFEGRTRLQSNFVAALCGPLIMVLAGLVLGFVILALFLPLIKLLNDLS